MSTGPAPPAVRSVWLASYPKSGSTWFRALLWALDHPGPEDADIDLDGLAGGPISSDRAVFDDATGLDGGSLPGPVVDDLRGDVHAWLWQRPEAGRVVGGAWVRKTHDAFAPWLAGATGAVYLVRNPLDVCVSFAHHQGGADLDDVIGQLADPAHDLTGPRDRRGWQLPQPVGTWSEHVRTWLGQAAVPVRVVRYEDLHAGDVGVLAAALAVCGRPVAADVLASALRRCRFARLAGREARAGFRERSPVAPSFFREGRAGAWRDHLVGRQVRRLVGDHGAVMQRLGYLDQAGRPI